MGRARFAVLAGTVLLAVSAVVHAQNAYTARVANLRAGPDRSYPLVASIDAGAPVNINGCLSDWSWCDVSFDVARGWVYAKSLSFVYQGSRVPFYTYAPSFGLPVVTFSLGAYWDRYYRGRPFYAQRGVWLHRPVPHMRPPGPPPRPGPPPHFAPGRGPQPGGPPPGGPRPGGNQAAPRHQAPPGRGAPPSHGGRPNEQSRGGQRGPQPQSRGGQGSQNDRGNSRRNQGQGEGQGEQPH